MDEVFYDEVFYDVKLKSIENIPPIM